MSNVRVLRIVVIVLVFLFGFQLYASIQAAVGMRVEVLRAREELYYERQAGERRRQVYLDVSKERVWHIRAGPTLVVSKVVLAVTPRVSGVGLQVAATFRPGLLGSPRTVHVLTTAEGWGADDKILPTSEGVVRVGYQFPLMVTEATISLAP